MAAIDSSVVNVALPHIQTTYGVTTQEVTWVTTSYLIAVVIIMPLTAWLGTVIGRKRMYLLAVTIFTLSSVACGFSRTLVQLIAFRVLQGLGAGALQPVAQAIMRETYPVEEQGVAMGLYGMVVLLGPAVGPTIGGWLTDNLSWPWIFFVNIPVGVVAMMMAGRYIADPEYMRARGLQRVDAIGILLLAVGLASLQTLLEEGEAVGWFASSNIVTLTIVAVAALIIFVIWELSSPAPAVDLRILKNLSFAAGTAIGGILGLTLFGSLILLPFFLQNLLHYSATQSGLTLIPRSLTMVLLMPIAGMLYNRLGVYVMLPFGLLTGCGAAFLMARLTLESGSLQILLPQVIQGIGFAFVFVSLSTTALSTIPRAKMQYATGLYNLVRQLGGSLGTAIVVALLDHRLTAASARLAGYASVYNPTFVQRWQALRAGLMAKGVDASTAGQQALALLSNAMHRQASVIAFNYVFALIGILSLACLPLVLLLRRGQRDGEAVATVES
jgi:DHA2 family multidrug resistance protein